MHDIDGSKGMTLESPGCFPPVRQRRHACARTLSGMRIGVIGADAISDTLALWWRQAGHQVALSSPGASVADAAEFGEAVLFAPGWRSAHDVLDRVGHALDGKPVLDATNPARTRGGPPV